MVCKLMPSPPPIRVAIIEDQEKIRSGLAAHIAGTDAFECAGVWSSMEEALPAIEGVSPDIALVDIGLPGISGIEGIRILKERRPGLALLVLTVYEDEDRIFGALCAGACGYLLKGTQPSRLIESLREAMAGGAPMTPQIARRVIEHFQTRRQPQLSPTYDLTPLMRCAFSGCWWMDIITKPPPMNSGSRSIPSASTCAVSMTSYRCIRRRRP